MKNIHILPTDKETRLYLSNYGKELNLASYPKTLYSTGQNIYITSYKSPSMNGYYLLNDNVVCKKDETYFATSWKEREIILTTDQDLIKDGVQAIDDDFLEWFVKNPSCEEVEIDKEQYHQFVGMKKIPLIPNYKIIIPKEEPKQHVELINDNIEEFDKAIELFKQETLEETIERLFRYYPESTGYIKAALIGKEWQQERSYSEEDMLDITKQAYSMGRSNYTIKAFNEWFEQFKKK